jgi:hypothetical protein
MADGSPDRAGPSRKSGGGGGGSGGGGGGRAAHARSTRPAGRSGRAAGAQGDEQPAPPPKRSHKAGGGRAAQQQQQQQHGKQPSRPDRSPSRGGGASTSSALCPPATTGLKRVRSSWRMRPLIVDEKLRVFEEGDEELLHFDGGELYAWLKDCDAGAPAGRPPLALLLLLHSARCVLHVDSGGAARDRSGACCASAPLRCWPPRCPPARAPHCAARSSAGRRWAGLPLTRRPLCVLCRPGRPCGRLRLPPGGAGL